MLVLIIIYFVLCSEFETTSALGINRIIHSEKKELVYVWNRMNMIGKRTVDN